MKPHEKPEAKPEMKKNCACGPECECGCNEGKECTCGCGCRCGCGEGKGCGCGCGCGEGRGCYCGKGCHCGSSCFGKLLLLLIIFLAGMGFNEFMHGCFGRCPAKGMRPAPMLSAPHHKVPHFTDGAGTVIIINADGSTDVQHGNKCGCHKHHKGMKHHQHYGAQPQQNTEAENK